MLTINASAKPSPIHGIGLFTSRRLSKGTVIWKFDPEFDRIFSPDEVEKMDEQKKEFIQHFAYLSKEISQYVLPVDDTRFINHSKQGNCTDVASDNSVAGAITIANRDINAGEEITMDYRLFDAHDEISGEEYLK